MSEDLRPILVIEEDGDFRVDWKGVRGEKNVLFGPWTEKLISGQFYLVPVEKTIVIDWGKIL